MEDERDKYNSFSLYMEDISRIEPMTEDERVECSQIIQNSSDEAAVEEATNRLILGNLGLVVTIAYGYKGRGTPFPDLIAEGNLGLIKSIPKYDPEKGKFSVYAGWWIRQHIHRALRRLSSKSVLLVPEVSFLKGRHIKDLIQTLEKSLGREVYASDLADHEGTTEKVISRWLAISKIELMSIEQASEDMGFDIVDETSDFDKKLQKDERTEVLRSAFSVLDDRERTIVAMKFGLDGDQPRTLREISKSLDKIITFERVRQILKISLMKMRRHIEKTSPSESRAACAFLD